VKGKVMRNEHWKGGTYHGKMMVQLICDNCETVITETDEQTMYNQNLSQLYAGMNTGTHECPSCKKSRERAYDVYVTTQH
jgi:hypothetical protein